MSPVTQNHQTAVGKGIWQEEQVTSARRWGVEKEDHSKNQTGSFSSFPCQGGATGNISHLCSDFILRLPNMSNGLSSLKVKEFTNTLGKEWGKEVPWLWKEGGGSREKCVSSVKWYMDARKLPSQLFHTHGAWLCWSGYLLLIKSQYDQED